MGRPNLIVTQKTSKDKYNKMGIERNPRDDGGVGGRQSDEDREAERRRDELRRENEQLRRESAQVDRELEESQRETARLREVLRVREQEVQRLRERVAAHFL